MINAAPAGFGDLIGGRIQAFPTHNDLLTPILEAFIVGELGRSTPPA